MAYIFMFSKVNLAWQELTGYPSVVTPLCNASTLLGPCLPSRVVPVMKSHKKVSNLHPEIQQY